MRIKEFEKRDLPKPLPIFKLIGPSFILLGLGLGSGELILWPYLSANFGLGIIWGAILGITFQFFINMEIERYTLATGESVFVGLTRKLGVFAPIWFIFSTFVPWIWPGVIASSATVLASLLGIEYSPILPIIMLVFIGVILTLGPLVYKTQESLQKFVIVLGVPFVFVVTFLISKYSDWIALSKGVIGKGESYWFLPAGIPLATFLGAFAYAGAGGNLNLSQSLYVKEKGYGMGKFSGRITSLITGKKENIRLEGYRFDINEKNLKNFKVWWRRVNLEHALVFWLTGALTMIVLSLLAYSSVYKHPDNSIGINFVINEAKFIGAKLGGTIRALFLITVSIMLFFTQFSVFGSTSRIMSENLAILKPDKINKTPLFFYIFLWIQIIAGILIFSLGFSEPLSLVVTSAVLNAFSMFVYSGFILWLNRTLLPSELKPRFFRFAMVFAAFIFYGGFSLFTLMVK